jgi:hypothetical protein
MESPTVLDRDSDWERGRGGVGALEQSKSL